MDAAAAAAKVALLATVALRFVVTAAGPVCRGQPADVIFAMDESSSIWPPHFRKQREFLANLTDGFDIGPEQTRIGVVTFADDYTSRFHLDAFRSGAEVKAALLRIDQKTGGTRTDLALKYIREKMLAKSRGDHVPRLVILVTDGVSSQRQQTSEQSTLLKSENVTILVVAISSQINWDEINSIASEPLAKHVFGIKSFNDLSHLVVGQLVRTACDVKENAPLPVTTKRRSTTTTVASATTPSEIRRATSRRPRSTATATAPRTSTAAAVTTAGAPTTTAASAAAPLPLIPSIRVYAERETHVALDHGRHGGGGGGGGVDWYKPPYLAEVDVQLLPPLSRQGSFQGLVERSEGVIRIESHSAAAAARNGGGADGGVGGPNTAPGYEIRGGGGRRGAGSADGRATIRLIAESGTAVKLHAVQRSGGDGGDEDGGVAVAVYDPVGDGDSRLSGVNVRVLPDEAASCDVRRKRADLAIVFGGGRRENAAATLEAIKSLVRDPAVPVGHDGVRLAAVLPTLPKNDMVCSCWRGDRYDTCDADFDGGGATEFGFTDYGADREAIDDHLSGRDRRRRGHVPPPLAQHLEQLHSRIFKARGGGARGGSDAKKVAVVVVDSLPHDLTPVLEEARLVKGAGIRLVLVGLGDAVHRRDALVALASDPPSKNAFVVVRAAGHSRAAAVAAEDIAAYIYGALC